MTDTTIKTSPATKVTITITAYKLWTNFMSAWTETSWDWDKNLQLNSVQQVALALFKDTLDTAEIFTLFKDGHTAFLLDETSFDLIDKPDTLSEIVVVKGDQRVVVPHENIMF